MNSILLSFCILFLGYNLGACTAISECPQQPADILFLVNGNNTANDDVYMYFNKSHQFIKTFTNFFEIGKDSVKVSMFDVWWWWWWWNLNTRRYDWYCGYFLDSFSNKSSLEAAMDGLINGYGYSLFDYNNCYYCDDYYINNYPNCPEHKNIFRFVRDSVFNNQKGARDKAYKIIIFLTNKQFPYSVVDLQLLKNDGVKIFAIGVGTEVGVPYLEEIASNDSYVHRVMTYDVLNTITELLINKSCTVITRNACEDDPCKNNGSCVWTGGVSYQCFCVPGYTGKQCQTDINECENITCLHGGHCIDGINKFTCNCTRFYSGRICEKDLCQYLPADIVFILDGSYSIDTFFDQQKLIIKNLIQNLTISTKDVQIGLITYSTDSEIVATLNQFTNKNLLQRTLQNITFQNRASFLSKGLKDANSVLSDTLHGGKRHLTRGDPKEFVVILFDGLTSDPSQTLQEARRLRQDGIEILAVAVGQDFYHQNALDIVGGKRENVLIHQDNDRLYNRIMYELSDPGCFNCTYVNKTDMIFLVDVSSNIRNVHLMKTIPTILRNITGSFPVGVSQNGVRYSLITYHTEAKVEFDFTKFDGNVHATINSYVSHFQKMSGNANVTSGLEEAVNMFQHFQSDYRKKQLVIISSFTSCIDKFTDSILETLKQKMKIEIIIISLGCDDKRRKVINKMATSAAHTFYICDDFKDNMEPLLANMQDSLCERLN